VSDDSARTVVLDRIWASLASQGYVLTDDQEIGLPEEFGEDFRQAYFNETVLRHDPGDFPVDRLRARDVIRYNWCENGLHLREHDRITLTDRAGIAGEREHSRVRLLRDPRAEELIRAFLRLVPASRRQADGTFGVNLFRTFTDVVTTPHHDNEEFIILYVLDRVGGGAESYLYRRDDDPDSSPPVLRHQLNKGQILIFEDKRFKHGATPLQSAPDGTASRDVLVCTVDYRSSYLGASPLN
jgi:2OG-Fe dioxygenase